MEILDFDNIIRIMVERLPEVSERYEAEEQRHAEVGGQPTQYGVFWFVLQPFLEKLLDSGKDSVLLRRVFDFFEDMARSPDIEVVSLLCLEVLEWLVGQPRRLHTAWKYMGEETRKLARETAQTYRCETNLPEGA